MKALIIGILLLFPLLLCAQTSIVSTGVDTRYLEDQFYMGITYNLLLSRPENVGQQNLSYGLRLGFIKDIPLNLDRTVALGLGIGYGAYSYYSSLVATETVEGIVYSLADTDDDFRRNKLETHMLEVPIEFRWRKSSPTVYKFWRIYTGINLSYVVGARSKFVGSLNDETIRNTFTNTDVTKFQYGLTFNIGWNTFNVHAYYALNKLFQDSTRLDGQSIDIRPLRLGFIFYIL